MKYLLSSPPYAVTAENGAKESSAVSFPLIIVSTEQTAEVIGGLSVVNMPSLAPQSVVRASSSRTLPSQRIPKRHLATPTSHPSSPSLPSVSSANPSLRASILLSRTPLLLRTPTPLESTYYAHSHTLRHALSNPPSTEFYFRPDSLPLRRFQLSEHAFRTRTYGGELAGPVPEVGDLPTESGIEEVDRDKWAREDSGRGEKSLERMAEEEVFCLVMRKEGQGEEGKWEFPSVDVGDGEGLHEAVERGLGGVDGGLGGRGMDSWLVTRKPIGVIHDGDTRVSLRY